MSVKSSIPLQIQKDIEQGIGWVGINSPYDLALYCSRVLSVDPKQFNEFKDIIPSNLQPSDTTKLWIKTDPPYAIGVPIGDGQYKMFYQYPQNTAFLFMGDEIDIPIGLRKLTDSELVKFSLTAPTDSAYWVTLNA